MTLLKPAPHLKMHVCDESAVQLRILVEGLVAGENHLQQFLPTFKRIIVLTNQKADERELKLGQNFFDSEIF